MSYKTHVGKHFEEIALAAFPIEYDSDEEFGEIAIAAASIEYDSDVSSTRARNARVLQLPAPLSLFGFPPSLKANASDTQSVTEGDGDKRYGCSLVISNLLIMYSGAGYACDYPSCGIVVKHKRDLPRHKREVHQLKEFFCPNPGCEKRYKREARMKKHAAECPKRLAPHLDKTDSPRTKV